ncbi:MAG: hypothetical protein ACM3VS_13375 [Candidatus Dadabacteria bacterium]
MILQIDDRLTVDEVQDRFNECFSFLKLAFYSKSHKRFEKSNKEDQYDGRMLIGDIRNVHINGPFEIKSWYTTAMVEKELKEVYGLNAQIFRWDKVNGQWIQTSLSDDLTLMEQTQFAYQQLAAADPQHNQ